MTYVTTRLRQLKSYPSYQFYSQIVSDTLTADDIFSISVLEIFRWLRNRLQQFESLPAQLNLPEPEQYASFQESKLQSFSVDFGGLRMDAVSVAHRGCWAFQMRENDMGANPGQPTERKPVQGRTFTTEISFCKQKDFVEFGVRTICTEPADSNAPCEVFRPAFVRALAGHPDMKLRCHCNLDGTPMQIASRSDVEKLAALFEDERCSFPIILIAESPLKQEVPDVKALASSMPYQTSFRWNTAAEPLIDLSKADLPAAKIPAVPVKDKTEKGNKKPLSSAASAMVHLPGLESSKLASSLLGFCLVCTVGENCFRHFKHKWNLEMECGDVLFCSSGDVLDSWKYRQYAERLHSFQEELKVYGKSYPLRRTYQYGNVMFYADACLSDVQEKKRKNLTLEEKCALLQQENTALRQQLRQTMQQNTDMQQSEENLRAANKTIRQLQAECEARQVIQDKLHAELEARSAAYRMTADFSSFYRSKAEAAVRFPQNTEDICDWIETVLGNDLAVSSRARSVIRKYSGALDETLLFDGLYYLSGYARYRRGEITEQQLSLYTEQRNWIAEPCGKETLRVHRADYTITYDGKKYLLDQHIKYGVKAQQLIRIYFCWDDSLGKIIIGCFPDHLPTIKNST